MNELQQQVEKVRLKNGLTFLFISIPDSL